MYLKLSSCHCGKQDLLAGMFVTGKKIVRMKELFHQQIEEG